MIVEYNRLHKVLGIEKSIRPTIPAGILRRIVGSKKYKRIRGIIR